MEVMPINGCILVKLTDNYQFVATPDKKYDTKTSGIVVAIDAELASFPDIRGKKVYFEEYKDGTTIEEDGDKYSLIKFDDVRGFRNA
jgi:co-chaperonin GroES (HSP10)